MVPNDSAVFSGNWRQVWGGILDGLDAGLRRGSVGLQRGVVGRAPAVNGMVDSVDRKLSVPKALLSDLIGLNLPQERLV
jgi:hypothetical protein